VLFSFAGKAQSLTFCKSVDKTGKSLGSSQEFTISKDGGKVTFLFQFSPSTTPMVSEISYDMYVLDKGKEVFNSTMQQAVNANQKWLSKEVTFYQAGTYRVYVYDEKDQLLTKGTVTIRQATD